MDTSTTNTGTGAENFVLCFDHCDGDSSHLDSLLSALDGDNQLVWRGTDIAAAYRLLVEQWHPGDAIYLFGARCGAARAQALSRLLDIVGVLRDVDYLIEYALAAWTLPKTRRSQQDWARLATLGAALRDGQPSVPVRYLGLWDMATIAGRHGLSTLRNVGAGRHAVGIDEYHRAYGVNSPGVDEVWFRGSRIDVSGAPGARAALAQIAGEWVLDGARTVGLGVRIDADLAVSAVPNTEAVGRVPAMTSLAGTRLSNRVVPEGSLVHASVQPYLQVHGRYRRHLPQRVVWVDTEWSARPERLLARTDDVVAHTTDLQQAS